MNCEEVYFSHFHGFTLDADSLWCACNDCHNLVVFVASNAEVKFSNITWGHDGVSKVFTAVVQSDMTIIVFNVVLVQKDTQLIGFEITGNVNVSPVETSRETKWLLRDVLCNELLNLPLL